MASYLAGEDEKTYTIQAPGGQVVRKKEGAFDAPGSEYSIAKMNREAQAAQPSGLDNFVSNTLAPALRSTPFGGMFQQNQTAPSASASVPVATTLTPTAAVSPMVGPPASAAPIDQPRAPAAQPQMPAPSTGMGSNVVQLGSSSTVTERPIVDQNALNQMESNSLAAAKATEKAYATEGQITKERGEAAKQQAAAKDQMAAQRQASADAAQQQFLDYQKKSDALQKDYANTEIRPAGYFEGDLGGNILAGIGIMLGAVGGALQGTGRNAATEVIDRAIDRDLQAQKMNLDKKREAISVLGQNYQAARQAGFDDAQARMLAKADAYDAIASYTEAKVAPLQGSVIQQKGIAEAANYKAKAAEARMNATKGVQRTTNSSEAKILDGGKAEKLPEAAAKDAAGHVAAHYAIGELRELYEVLDGQQTGVVDGRINELRSKFGLQDANEAQIQQRIKTFAQDRIKNLTGAGSSDAERAEIEKTLPRLFDNPGAFRAKIEQLDEDNARNYMLIQKQYQNPAGYTYQNLQSPGAERARIKVNGKPTTATKPR